MDSTKTLYFTDETETYYLAGKITDYFYEGGYMPDESNTCSDIIEKLQFVYELWLQSNSGEFFDKDLPDEITEELTEYFESMDESEVFHGELLHFKNFSAKKFTNSKGVFDENSGQVILTSGKLKLFVPVPYENLSCWDSGEDLSHETSDKLKKIKKFSFSTTDSIEWLFMSTSQLKTSHKNLDEIIKPVSKIFSKHGIKMKSCEDLVKFILS
jgi:hypothetical protein